MKKKLKVLHIASFVGNVGDNANHRGAEYLRNRFLDFQFEVTQKEIRAFYWKDWLFNSTNFVDEANRYDLIMIGGGNYFELWVDNSSTGTSIDISLEYLKLIKTPILFYSLGCDLGQGTSELNVQRFERFLDFICNSGNFYVSVRNDGSYKNLISLYGNKYEGKIRKIADGGFFTQVKRIKHFEVEEGKKNILINIAGDMIDIRFNDPKSNLTYNDFLEQISSLIEYIAENDSFKVNIILVPHIFRDIKIIYDVLDKVKDSIRRTVVKVAPYLTGDKGCDYIFSLYEQCDLVLAMRFHANVCSFALKKSLIGIVCYQQIKNLFEELESSEFVEVSDLEFERQLGDMVFQHLQNQKDYEEESNRISRRLLKETEIEYQLLNNWLKLNFGG